MKNSILSLALGMVLASPDAAYAGGGPNPVNALEDLFYGSDHSHRAYHETVGPPPADPFKPRQNRRPEQRSQRLRQLRLRRRRRRRRLKRDCLRLKRIRRF
jgi:hypothetical protein